MTTKDKQLPSTDTTGNQHQNLTSLPQQLARDTNIRILNPQPQNPPLGRSSINIDGSISEFFGHPSL
jgi:hypothetical protein